MKVQWEAADIRAGRRVGRPGRVERWMVGYDAALASGSPGRLCLISLLDGMIGRRFADAAEFASYLTNADELPVELLEPEQ